MQRFLTAAAVVSTMALATSGLALAQGATTSPSGTMNPSTSAPATTTPGMTPSSGVTNPSTGSMSSPSPSAQNATDMNTQQSPGDIRQAQEQLKQQGLYKGRVDGKMGQETAEAISKFQQQNGLPQNSQLDPQTMAKLGGNGGMSTNGSGSSTPPASMKPSTSNPGAGSSMGSGGASTPSGTTSTPTTTGTPGTSH